MHENDIALLEEAFKKYYFDHFDLIHVPEKPSEREFGYQKFDSGMIRHLSVKDDKELHLMLISNKPSDVYCSNAYYSFPSLPMQEKDWRGRVSKELFDSKSKRSKTITQLMTQGYSSFQNQLQVMSKTIGVMIDPNVTMDIHRIFRLPGSINSKSGLSKIFCNNLEEFNPYSDACFIDDESIEVTANCPIDFSLKNKKFGPYKNEKVTVPKYAAVYMICKGLASIA